MSLPNWWDAHWLIAGSTHSGPDAQAVSPSLPLMYPQTAIATGNVVTQPHRQICGQVNKRKKAGRLG